ncbi:JamP [Paenibacillus mucilaginosus K02]|uniref:JamP n=2 Tax=Paenibacillus mucilaginosus TaxID=61624 RepID=I0BL66_9BACL|nr:JamP [Paenibacillus mucilaginosus K02]
MSPSGSLAEGEETEMITDDTLWEQGVAVIGMSGRFPGASDLEGFWQMLCEGRHGIRFFTEEELRENGVPEEQWKDPGYVRAKGMLSGPELFDAAFFGMPPREAEWTDPQQRLFLECSYEALESAGWVPDRYEGRIGVFGGCSMSTYLLHRIALQQGALGQDAESLILGCDKDFLTSRTAYKLNLRGPAVTVQTACSTSLVAVHLACQSLLSGECDMALAGGSSVSFPNAAGYRYQEGMILSPDGFCRTFDSEAQGTVPGNGVGVVALKRLELAAADGDPVYAVIRGSAANNDGGLKAGFTAPSPEGQAEVIADALAVSGVHPETIGYVEAHGTATPVGDPIEIAGLTRAYRQWTERSGYCAIGSVKSNLGHLDCAAGVAGLVKTVLALHHRKLPPSLHYHEPNPQLRLEDSPFYVQTQLGDWPEAGHPRRAGVSSFGIGATNAHVILEEAPSLKRDPSTRPWHVLPVSAGTETALEAAAERLREHLTSRLPGPADVEEIAYTLQVGRRGFPLRQAVVCRNGAEAVHRLGLPDTREPGQQAPGELRDAAWLFLPWRESDAEGLIELYRTEPVFRQHLQERLTAAEQASGLVLQEPVAALAAGSPGGEAPLLTGRSWTVVSMAASYSLGLTLQDMGLQPGRVGGEEEGEAVAAILAGLCTWDEAVRRAAEAAEPGGAVFTEARGVPVAVQPRAEKLHASPVHTKQAGRPAIDEVQAVLRTPGHRVIVFGSPPSDEDGVIGCHDSHSLSAALAALWTDGAEVDWQARYRLEKRQRVHLPTYPFERQYYSFLPPLQAEAPPPRSSAQEPLSPKNPIDGGEEPNPRTELETTLIRFHSEVLGLPEEEIRTDVPFYELGADSLSMTQIISRIQKAYPFPLNVRQLYEAQTIAELADSIEWSVLDLLEQEEERSEA